MGENSEVSREAFQTAEMERDSAQKNIDVDKQIRHGEGFGIVGWATSLSHDLRLIEAEDKLKELLATGQEEAEALNEEYERLKNDTKTSIEALHTFEVEKLGMKE